MFKKSFYIFLLSIIFVFSSQVFAQTLKLPYIDAGACPFECCTYRQWVANRDTVLLKNMSNNSPIAFRVRKGEKVTGMTGVVITTKAGVVKVLKNTTIDEEGKVRVNTGDILYLLTYLGEGYYRTWYKGRIEVGSYYENPNVKQISEPEAIWWVKIKNRKGQIGWTKLPENFDNKDGCGDTEANSNNDDTFMDQSGNEYVLIPVNPQDNTSFTDELNGSSIGESYGVSYIDALDGKGAVFSQKNESRIQYPTQIPSEGTIEWWINVQGGYRYENYKLLQSTSNALIFTTAAGDVWYPGSTWLNVHSDGTLTFDMATTKYEGPKQTLIAKNTNFKFNQWHSVGISFGSQGQYIMLDGKIVASATQNTQNLGRGGNHQTNRDVPTIGEMISGFWANNQYDAGFEGIVDKVRISKLQKDWKISKENLLQYNKTTSPDRSKTTSVEQTKRNSLNLIRKIDFRNFSYLVTSVFLDEPAQIKTIKGKYLKGSRRNYDFWEFTVDKVIYGDLTGDGEEEALVSAIIEQSGANPANSFDEGYYIYTIENTKPKLLGSFTRSDFWNIYMPYQNENDECDGWVWGTKGNIINQKLIINLFVGGRQCVENGYDVTMAYNWNGSQFVLEGNPIRKKSVTK